MALRDRQHPYVGVIGSGEVDPDRQPETLGYAREVGATLAERGAVVVCGGLGGVMEAVCRGATEAGGMTVGILPGSDRLAANPYVTVPVATGLGEVRNAVVVRASEVLIAIGGSYGTLSEIALGLQLGRAVVGLGTWGLERPQGGLERAVSVAGTPQEAVALAMERVVAARANARD